MRGSPAPRSAFRPSGVRSRRIGAIPHCGSGSGWPRESLPLSQIPSGVTQGAWRLLAAAGAERLSWDPTRTKVCVLVSTFSSPFCALNSQLHSLYNWGGGRCCPTTPQGKEWGTAEGGPPLPVGKARDFRVARGFHCDLAAGGGLPSLGARRQSWKSPGRLGRRGARSGAREARGQ